MRNLPALLLLSIATIFATNLNAQQKGHNLYRIYPDDFNKIRSIESTGINVINSSFGNYLDIRATPEQLKELGIANDKIEFLANDFADLLDKRLKSGSYADYHNHQETVDLLNEFASNFPEITQLDTIGYSVLGREICSIKISDNPGEDEDETPIMILGCHHGNEVLSVEATLYQIDFLLNNYYSDPEVTAWINNMEIWFVPLVNPDGREAIRRYNENGVDLNRNYSFEHTPGGNHGPSGFSEPETQAIRDLAAMHPPVMSLTFHTSGRLILLPWTHTDESAPDSLALSYLGNIIAESIVFPAGAGTNHYELRQGGDWYFTAGEYCDYMYANHNTSAYTVEMWTSQTPPADVIPQVIERNLEGMKTLLRQAGKAGITGTIKDKATGLPLVAKVDFPEIEKQAKVKVKQSDEKYGRYYKYTTPGIHIMEISAPGYRTITRDIEISEEELLNLDFEMDPAPELILSEFSLSDTPGGRIFGNTNGQANIGETIGIYISLYNDQMIPADETYIRVSSPSPYIDFITDSLYFGAINHNSAKQSADTLLFKLNASCPNLEEIDFKIDISDKISFAWKENFSITAYTPDIVLGELNILDEFGNQNGVIDNGEKASASLEITNTGSQGINEVMIRINDNDPYFSIFTDDIEISELGIGETEFIEFDIELSAQAPEIYAAYIDLSLSSSEGFEAILPLQLTNIIGYFDDFENGENSWTHASYGDTPNNHDDWQLGNPEGKAGDPESPYSGNNCWGTDLGWDLYLGESWNGEYQNNVHNYLQSPEFDCSNMTDIGIRYKRWLTTRFSDIASILVNDNLVWKSSVRGHSDQEWEEHNIDISEYADGNPNVRIKFELKTSANSALGGWNIDDFMLASKLGSGTSSINEDNNIAFSDLLWFYPNPSQGETRIEYYTENEGEVEITIFDLMGKKISTLVSNIQTKGNHSVIWDGKGADGNDIGNGLYFIRMISGDNYIQKSIVVLR